MKDRSYQQYCALAYALDAVGERWTLLIIRELLAGPRRFKDLVQGLPGISTNLLAERLKGLEQQAILLRRTLPPPAGSTVYELTPLGRGLEKSILELGKWGSQLMPAIPICIETPAEESAGNLPSLGAIALALKTFFRPEKAQDVRETYLLCLGDELLHVEIKDGKIEVQQGLTRKADAVFRTTMQVFVELFSGQIEPQAALAGRLIQVEGNTGALERFLNCTGVQSGQGGKTLKLGVQRGAGS